ncbi:hypothetical protein CAOG_04614 [Capsaspora owczarzaki ATCC 30864]|uniref:RING-type domain-containing protein n=1 Tax=Capsaspora owczarzaki (strain ATCC 30864) TaxID=595528 RepID=A0A0D2UFI7_CAPO3|nr:hypothetical protein CAOG_04614 [Capsaspora owczarzaki ATCC 30864]KJE93896.1 hypothetical protein CAOG_004614 [Capsaspora owczarzaki ATCC 30864]|eukprot:XP_004347361.1 hypothetical protein CAOG_04614 [Capsaspora owczarzaki ATCC 30864]
MLVQGDIEIEHQQQPAMRRSSLTTQHILAAVATMLENSHNGTDMSGVLEIAASDDASSSSSSSSSSSVDVDVVEVSNPSSTHTQVTNAANFAASPACATAHCCCDAAVTGAHTLSKPAAALDGCGRVRSCSDSAAVCPSALAVLCDALADSASLRSDMSMDTAARETDTSSRPSILEVDDDRERDEHSHADELIREDANTISVTNSDTPDSVGMHSGPVATSTTTTAAASDEEDVQPASRSLAKKLVGFVFPSKSNPKSNPRVVAVHELDENDEQDATDAHSTMSSCSSSSEDDSDGGEDDDSGWSTYSSSDSDSVDLADLNASTVRQCRNQYCGLGFASPAERNQHELETGHVDASLQSLHNAIPAPPPLPPMFGPLPRRSDGDKWPNATRWPKPAYQDWLRSTSSNWMRLVATRALDTEHTAPPPANRGNGASTSSSSSSSSTAASSTSAASAALTAKKIFMFSCIICFDELPIESDRKTSLSACSCDVCKTCLKTYFEERISVGMVKPCCPEPTCKLPESDAALKEIVSKDKFSMLERFRITSSDNPCVRSCPFCFTLNYRSAKGQATVPYLSPAEDGQDGDKDEEGDKDEVATGAEPLPADEQAAGVETETTGDAVVTVTPPAAVEATKAEKRSLLARLREKRVVVDERDQKVQCCSCTQEFCFSCQAPYHTGMSCKDFSMGDIGVEDWSRQVGARRCPRCKTRIARDSGCDHMHCTVCSMNQHQRKKRLLSSVFHQSDEWCYGCGCRYISLGPIGNHHSAFSIVGCNNLLFKNMPPLRMATRATALVVGVPTVAVGLTLYATLVLPVKGVRKLVRALR